MEKVEKKFLQIMNMKMTNDKANNQGINVQKIYKILSEELKIEKQNATEPIRKENLLLEKIQTRREEEKKKHNLSFQK